MITSARNQSLILVKFCVLINYSEKKKTPEEFTQDDLLSLLSFMNSVSHCEGREGILQEIADYLFIFQFEITHRVLWVKKIIRAIIEKQEKTVF